MVSPEVSMEPSGIVSYGVYLPYNRIERASMTSFLEGEKAAKASRGTRSVASYDEDALTMGVEAARAAFRARGVGDVGDESLLSASVVDEVILASSALPYMDRTNATVVHDALGLRTTCDAFDLGPSISSGSAALRLGSRAGVASLCVLSDLRSGLPGSQDELQGADGAAAFLFAPPGSGLQPIARLVASVSASEDIMDRWRSGEDGEAASHVWEERFAEKAYAALVGPVMSELKQRHGVDLMAVDHVAVTGSSSRVTKALQRQLGLSKERVVDDLSSIVGNAGAAQAGLMLAGVLDVSMPGETVALIQVADGLHVLVFQVTGSLASFKAEPTLQEAISGTRTGLDYARFLTWKGTLVKEPPRRPDPQAPAAPASWRSRRWKYAFMATKCTSCGTLQMPPQRVCVHCGTVDEMDYVPMSEAIGKVATFAVDWLAYSMSPPVVAAVVDFDGGGRFECELTDVDPESVAIGNRVKMTFRCLANVEGVRNYFWKARPLREEER
jgi:hydroxymethylglutaryl-CoA synthase